MAFLKQTLQAQAIVNVSLSVEIMDLSDSYCKDEHSLLVELAH